MTREELKEHCKKQIEGCKMWAEYRGEEPTGRIYEEHKLILELLEQELCEDAISRQAVYDAIKSMSNANPSYWNKCDVVDREDLINEIEQLPSVNPQEPKTGHWIPTYGNVKCSVCGSVKESRRVGKATHYCDFCGAKMIEAKGEQ